MAVGSNSLALLFKIGVDAGDAQKEITSLTTAFKDGLGKGALQGVKDFEKQASGAFERVGQSLQQTRSGLENLFRGDVLEGTTQLVRQFGVLAVGLGAVAVAGLAVKKSIEGIIDVADKIGTDSKDDFEELQKSMARVGETVTLLDHGLSQQLLKSAGDVKTAFDAMFLEMLRVEGPALILLFKEVVRVIHDVLIPAADSFAARQVEGIVQFIGLIRGLQAIHNLPTGLMGTDFREWAGIVQGYVKQTRTELESLQAKLKGDIGDFAPPKSPHVAALKAQIDEFQKALDAAQKDFDAFQKRLDDTLIKSMEDLSKSVNQQVLDQQKALADRKQQWLDYAQFVRKEIDQIVVDLARQAQPIPGGAKGIPGLPDDATIQKGLDDAFKHYESFFEKIKTGAASAGQTLTDQLTKALEDLPINLIEAFTKSFENLLDTFIQTGHTGPAVLKQFVAAVLRQLGTMAAQFAAISFALALFYLAMQDYKDAALATLAGIGFTAIAVGLGFAAAKVAPSSASASAGAGTGFGGAASEAPGTVTINQGAATSGLGIQLQILNALQNITTAPPGDILQRGADQNPMAVGQANNEAARRDGSVSREFLQISGLRTA
jgi:hypothetical protein